MFTYLIFSCEKPEFSIDKKKGEKLEALSNVPPYDSTDTIRPSLPYPAFPDVEVPMLAVHIIWREYENCLDIGFPTGYSSDWGAFLEKRLQDNYGTTEVPNGYFDDVKACFDTINDSLDEFFSNTEIYCDFWNDQMPDTTDTLQFHPFVSLTDEILFLDMDQDEIDLWNEIDSTVMADTILASGTVENFVNNYSQGNFKRKTLVVIIGGAVLVGYAAWRAFLTLRRTMAMADLWYPNSDPNQRRDAFQHIFASVSIRAYMGFYTAVSLGQLREFETGWNGNNDWAQYWMDIHNNSIGNFWCYFRFRRGWLW